MLDERPDMMETFPLSDYAAQLSGSFIALPPMPRAHGKVVIFARHHIPDSTKYRLDAIEFEANHIEQSLREAWPGAMFYCDRASYDNGRLLFYRRGEKYGFGVSLDQPVTVTSGEVDRSHVEGIDTHDVLTDLAAKHLVDVRSLDPNGPADAGLEDDAEVSPAITVVPVIGGAAPYANIWVPARITSAAIALFGLAICFGAYYDFANGFQLNSIIDVVVGVGLIVYGTLASAVDPTRFKRMVWAVIEPSHRPSRWQVHVILTLIGVVLIAIGIGYAGSAMQFAGPAALGFGAIAMAFGIGLKGLMVALVGAILVGYNVIQLIPGLNDEL